MPRLNSGPLRTRVGTRAIIGPWVADTSAFACGSFELPLRRLILWPNVSANRTARSSGRHTVLNQLTLVVRIPIRLRLLGAVGPSLV